MTEINYGVVCCAKLTLFAIIAGVDVKVVEELAKKYKQSIQSFDKQGLRLISEDRAKAIEYAKKGIGQIEPENLNDEYVERVANEMQSLSKMILEERSQAGS